MYRIALFDIDGTLCDPRTGIVDAARHALTQVGISEDDPAALRRFVGPPLEHSFRDLYALTPAQVDQAVAAYRDRYGTQGVTLYRPYPGIEAVLQELTAAGVRLAVVTAKIQQFADQALRTMGLHPFFELVAGRAPDQVVTKTVTLRRAPASGSGPGAGADDDDSLLCDTPRYRQRALRCNGCEHPLLPA